MEDGYLYFVKDEFYERFSQYGLLNNKETVNGKLHGRPCCCVLKINDISEQVYWMVPISSQVSKYEAEYKHAFDKYGMCDNISFGYVLGRRCAFLPQNLFPVTKEYISNVYLDSNTAKPIIVPRNLLAELKMKSRKKLRYNKIGKKLGLSDAWGIYNQLKND